MIPQFSAPTGISVAPGTPSVVGTEITFPATSDRSLVGALYGVEFGIGVGAGYVWSESVAGAASSQTITIDIATYGGTTSSTVNARIYYNLDVLDDPSTRVYSAMLAPIVVSASLSGTTTEGQTLTGANGIIVGGYQMTLTQSWAACNTAGTSCTMITAATAATYVLTADEVGDTIKYTKTATNTAGSGSATSNASAVVAPSASPVTLGTVFDGPAAVNSNTQTLSSVTVDAGTNRLLVALPTWSNGTAGRVITGIVLDPGGVNKAFTQLTGAVRTTQSSVTFLYYNTDVWYIKDADLPAAGTYDIVVTATNFVRMTTGVINYSAVGNQTTPLVASNNGATTNSATVTAGAISTTANDQVCGCACIADTVIANVASANTEQWEVNELNFNDGAFFGATASGTGANVNMTWNQTGSNGGFSASSAKVQA